MQNGSQLTETIHFLPFMFLRGFFQGWAICLESHQSFAMGAGGAGEEEDRGEER